MEFCRDTVKFSYAWYTYTLKPPSFLAAKDTVGSRVRAHRWLQSDAKMTRRGKEIRNRNSFSTMIMMTWAYGFEPTIEPSTPTTRHLQLAVSLAYLTSLVNHVLELTVHLPRWIPRGSNSSIIFSIEGALFRIPLRCLGRILEVDWLQRMPIQIWLCEVDFLHLFFFIIFLHGGKRSRPLPQATASYSYLLPQFINMTIKMKKNPSQIALSALMWVLECEVCFSSTTLILMIVVHP